jgi:hypothetical protein
MSRPLGALLLALVLSTGIAQDPRDATSRVAPHITPEHRALMERWKEALESAQKVYLDGLPQDAIPLLLRYLELEIQIQNEQLEIIRAAKLDPGLGTGSMLASHLAFAHGRLALSYLALRNGDKCQYHLDQALVYARKAASLFSRDFGEETGPATSMYGMDTPQKIFAGVRRFDESLRPNKAFPPLRSDCVVQPDARKSPPRAAHER